MQICIENLPVNLRIGHYPDERTSDKNVDVSLYVTLLSHLGPELSDELERTVDYAEIIQLVDDKVAGKEFKLIETLAEIIGSSLLREFPLIGSVEVHVHKTELPHNIGRGAKVSVRKTFNRGKS